MHTRTPESQSSLTYPRATNMNECWQSGRDGPVCASRMKTSESVLLYQQWLFQIAKRVNSAVTDISWLSGDTPKVFQQKTLGWCLSTVLNLILPLTPASHLLYPLYIPLQFSGHNSGTLHDSTIETRASG